MTTNVWINHIMKDVSGFMGVFSIDTLINPTVYPSYIIVNFSPSNTPGTHFIAILFIEKNVCLYFDPLNLSYIPDELICYMNTNSVNIYKIKYTVQNLISGFCGFFCILPIMLHVNNISIYSGIKMLKEFSLENDDKCIQLLMKLFTLYYLERKI